MGATVLGLDIGGANLKAATASGEALSVPFPLWRHPEKLETALVDLVSRLPAASAWAATMTGELADCYDTKRAGVDSIVSAVVAAARQSAPSQEVRIWTVEGQFITPAQAMTSDVSRIAASNWSAQATWLARQFPDRNGMVVDIGSTTMDLIPFDSATVVASGRTDVQRLSTGELVYTGVRRTPLCAISPTLEYRGRACRLAAELFATTQDVYLLLNDIPEDASDLNTADGRPATVGRAYERLARMLCCDRTEFTPEEALDSARQFADAQLKQLKAAFRQVCPVVEGKLFLTSGSGEFLAQRLVREFNPQAEIRSLSDWHSPAVASAACAYAVACLLGQELD